MTAKKSGHPRKKKDTQPKKASGGQPDGPPPSFHWGTMERMMQQIQRLVNEQEFESGEELQAFLDGLVGQQPPVPAGPQTPLERAQDLIYDAWETQSARQRVKLAREALALSPDCADAYVLLAEETAKNAHEALDLYQEAVKAGERAIGPEAFEELKGDFWGALETRPYMRARLGLAQTLWELGSQQEAIEHLTDMLRLNPNDNQGIRYLLMSWLLQTGDDAAARKLHAKYRGEGSAHWLYSGALLAFRRGDRRASERLKRALRQNPFVPAYLLRRRRLPRRLPAYMGFGDDSEAQVYVSAAMEEWRRTPGALDWLASHVEAEE